MQMELFENHGFWVENTNRKFLKKKSIKALWGTFTAYLLGNQYLLDPVPDKLDKCLHFLSTVRP